MRSIAWFSGSRVRKVEKNKQKREEQRCGNAAADDHGRTDLRPPGVEFALFGDLLAGEEVGAAGDANDVALLHQRLAVGAGLQTLASRDCGRVALGTNLTAAVRAVVQFGAGQFAADGAINHLRQSDSPILSAGGVGATWPWHRPRPRIPIAPYSGNAFSAFPARSRVQPVPRLTVRALLEEQRRHQHRRVDREDTQHQCQVQSIRHVTRPSI